MGALVPTRAPLASPPLTFGGLSSAKEAAELRKGIASRDITDVLPLMLFHARERVLEATESVRKQREAQQREAAEHQKLKTQLKELVASLDKIEREKSP